jgi:hypothetical protein
MKWLFSLSREGEKKEYLTSILFYFLLNISLSLSIPICLAGRRTYKTKRTEEDTLKNGWGYVY